jgi:hypothetical protein
MQSRIQSQELEIQQLRETLATIETDRHNLGCRVLYMNIGYISLVCSDLIYKGYGDGSNIQTTDDRDRVPGHLETKDRNEPSGADSENAATGELVSVPSDGN